MDRTRWADLAPDALRHIAGRLHDAGDIVRFHAICRPWRDSRDAAETTMTTNALSLRPWLLAEDKDSTPIRFRCIFSKLSYRAPPPSTHRRNWVCRADGTAVRYLTVQHLRPSLHDPLTGQVTHRLPLFFDGQWEEESPHGVLYGDGTVLLYTKHDSADRVTARFRAMVLRPGDAEWTVVQRTLEIPWQGSFCAAYHDGKILVTMGASLWRIITPPPNAAAAAAEDVLVQKQWEWSEDAGDGVEHYNYLLESRGELLWASVWVHMSYPTGPKLRVLLYALEEKTRWVKRESGSLNNRVLFLGSPNSFAMDASMLGGGDGGYVYFAYCNSKALPYVQYGVFKYNLVNGDRAKYGYYINGKARLIERLPQGWGDVKCAWLLLQPHIASIQEIRKRSLEAQELKDHQTALVTSHISRHYEPCLKLVVRNLPVTVNSFQLQLFFSQHGKVSDAEILYYKKTKRSQGIGHLTLSTVHAHQQDALDALGGLTLEGCTLEVVLVKEGRPRYGRRRRSTRSVDLLDRSHSS